MVETNLIIKQSTMLIRKDRRVFDNAMLFSTIANLCGITFTNKKDYTLKFENSSQSEYKLIIYFSFNLTLIQNTWHWGTPLGGARRFEFITIR